MLTESGQPPVTNSPQLIRDGNMESFMQDVVERSMQVPVLVDFWATWCEPCKALTPALEQVVMDAAGAVELVKLDIDQNQQLATQMQIRSVPTVVMFKDGRPADAFAGAKTQTEIKEFIAKHVTDMGASPVEQMLEQAAMAEQQGDFQLAGGAYSQILQTDPENADALGGLIRMLTQLGDFENAGEVLKGVPQALENNPAISAARSALDMAQKTAELGDAGDLQARVENDENDHQARFDLALILWEQGQRDAAADQLLEIFRRDRDWNEDAARTQLVKFFDIAGPMDPFTVAARRKLSSLLFS